MLALSNRGDDDNDNNAALPSSAAVSSIFGSSKNSSNSNKENNGGGGLPVEKSLVRPKSAVELRSQGRRGEDHKNIKGRSRAIPLTQQASAAAEQLSTAKERHSGNIKKLIAQREQTAKLMLEKDKEVKSIRQQMKRQGREHKERER